MGRHRAWCFTINNPVEADLFGIQHFMRKAKYGIYGKEVGEKGTPHYQGYIHLENALSLEKCKHFLPRAHFSVAMGTDEQNYEYCSKDGDFVEIGTKSVGQGSRTDIKDVANLIKSGEITMMDLMFDYPELYVKYSRSFEKMFSAVQPHRENPPQVFWLWGLAGVGKSRYVIDKHTAEKVYMKDGTSWWDGYIQQEAILIDDFDNNIPYRTLLRILDRYRYQGQVKGGYVNINSPFIYITSEYPPSHYWVGNEYEQVRRRITSVSEIKKNIEL
nr:MAG: replication polyprotein [Owegonang virus 19]